MEEGEKGEASKSVRMCVLYLEFDGQPFGLPINNNKN
jgi:hypothetical protein